MGPTITLLKFGIRSARNASTLFRDTQIESIHFRYIHPFILCLYVCFYFEICYFVLQFDGVHVVSGSLDTSIRVWDAETGACKHTLMGHQSLTSGMELRNNILVSGNADSTVKVWDIISGKCLQTLSGKLNFFNYLPIATNFLNLLFFILLNRSQQAPIGCHVSSI